MLTIHNMNGPSSPDQGGPPDDDSVRAIEGILNDLYERMRQDIPFENKARQALKVGRDYLDADNGHLTRIDQETDHWEAVVSTDPPDGDFPPGLELDLQTTYCRRVLETNSQVAVNDAPNQGFAEDPAYKSHRVHCYVGTPLRINGEQYGTVCFVATDPQGEPYSESEKMLAELITHMLERELEREQYETQLLRQTNLSLVLNRVLRHNLRNKMAVARGYTQLMAEQVSESNYGQQALRSIDNVLNLSEKARELDEIIASDDERSHRNVRTLVEEVITDVRSEYPAASISIDGAEEVPAAILPSFRRAVRELIVNAAKHGGDEPTVEVTVELIPDAVKVRIADDGPGLDTQERDVLRSGSETPLTHGSGLGLWLTHWIISSHDGSIEPSVTDAGTTLTITVPRTAVADTEQPMRTLLRARDQYKAAFDKAGDGMTITDDEARILDVNDEAAELYGMDRQALIGRSIQDFLPADFDFEAEWGEIKASDRKCDEMRILSADGGVSTIEYTAKAHFVPGQHFIVSRDITESRESERETGEK